MNYGNDDQVVPAHGQIIDFNKVDDSNVDLNGGKKYLTKDETNIQEGGTEPEDVKDLKVQNIPQS